MLINLMDINKFYNGNQVLKNINLTIDESVLTGESIATVKNSSIFMLTPFTYFDKPEGNHPSSKPQQLLSSI